MKNMGKIWTKCEQNTKTNEKILTKYEKNMKQFVKTLTIRINIKTIKKTEQLYENI